MSKKVMVVDDSPVDLAKLQKILIAEKCEVVLASSGKEAIEKSKTENLKIIFMDIVMEEMDGYEATRTITNDPKTNTIPIIFVSSKKQKADRVWAKMQGGKELISKPYQADQIINQLKAYT